MNASTKLLTAAAAALVLLGACGNPSSEGGSGAGGSTGGGNSGSGGDQPVIYDPPGNKPGGGVAGGGGEVLVVAPRGDSHNPMPSHWEKVEILDDDTIKVFFWSGVEPCTVVDHVDLDYGHKQVGVTLYQGAGLNAADKPCIELAVYKAVEVDLDEPLDGRKIVDGITRRYERP